jgi:ATP-dependent Clp protease ATP-binding subunit ClpC
MVNVPDIATPRLRRALELAVERAHRDPHSVRSEHLLLGMLDEGTGDAPKVLTRLGIGVAALRDAAVEQLAAAGEPRGNEPDDHTSSARALALAEAEAAERGHHYLGQEHLLLGLLREPESPVARLLARLGATYERVVAEFDGMFA